MHQVNTSRIFDGIKYFSKLCCSKLFWSWFNSDLFRFPHLFYS